MGNPQEFKQTEIGKIPEGWEVERVQKVFDVYGGTTPSTSNKEYWDGEILWVTPTDITRLNGSIYLDETEKKITDKAVKACSLNILEEGTLLLTSRATIGFTAINTKPVTINQGMTALIPKDKGKVYPLFYAYYFQQLKSYLEQLGAGSTFREVSKSTLKNLKVHLPSLPEQTKIAEILATADEAIEKVDEAIEKTQRLKKGLMQELLTKGIGHKESKDTEIGKIPKEWEVVKLTDIGTLQYGVTASSAKDYTGIKFLRITDIKDEGIDWEKVPYCELKDNELKKYELRFGDVLFARIGATTGKTCFVDKPVRGAFGSYLIRFQPNRKDINTKFLYFYTQFEIYWLQIDMSKGGQLKKGLNSKLLGSIKLSLPPLPEQQKITDILSTVDKRLELLRERKERLGRIKKGLMNDLLTGKRRVK